MACDLDAIQARYERGMFSSDPAVAFAVIEDVPALVTGLRAALKARGALHDLYSDLDATDGTAVYAYRLQPAPPSRLVVVGETACTTCKATHQVYGYRSSP